MKHLYILAILALTVGVVLSSCRKPEEPSVPERSIDSPQAAKPTQQPRQAPLPGDPFGDVIPLADAMKALQRQMPTAEMTDDQRERLRRLQDEMGTDLPASEKLALLNSAGDIYSPQMLEIINRALDDDDPQVRLTAMSLIGNTADANVLPIVSKALDDEDESVRQAAVSSLALVDSSEVTELLTKGLNDEALFVRKSVLDVATQQPEEVRYPVYQAAIMNDHRDVQFESITYLQKESSHAAMDVLIEGLQHSNKEHHEDVIGAIEFLIQKRFESYDEAKRWWNANKQNYNSQLFDKSLGFPDAP